MTGTVKVVAISRTIATFTQFIAADRIAVCSAGHTDHRWSVPGQSYRRTRDRADRGRQGAPSRCGAPWKREHDNAGAEGCRAVARPYRASCRHPRSSGPLGRPWGTGRGKEDCRRRSPAGGGHHRWHGGGPEPAAVQNASVDGSPRPHQAHGEPRARQTTASRTATCFRSAPRSGSYTSPDIRQEASASTYQRSARLSSGTHCSTSSVGGYTHQPQESPSSQERRCGRWRSSSTWSSTSSASATSRPCGGSPAKRLEGLSSGTPPDQRGLQWLSELTCWNATFAPVRDDLSPLYCAARG